MEDRSKMNKDPKNPNEPNPKADPNKLEAERETEKLEKGEIERKPDNSIAPGAVDPTDNPNKPQGPKPHAYQPPTPPPSSVPRHGKPGDPAPKREGDVITLDKDGAIESETKGKQPPAGTDKK